MGNLMQTGLNESNQSHCCATTIDSSRSSKSCKEHLEDVVGEAVNMSKEQPH